MIEQIRPSQLAAWLDRVRPYGEPLVLDVREPSELRVAGVKADGFTLLTIPMGVIPPRLNELNPAQPVACLCHHGVRSQHAAYFLSQRGFTDLYDISGGIDAWAGIDRSIARY